MLHEIMGARQVLGEGRRRWFTSENFDLIVWYGDDDCIIGFQLCYDKSAGEHAVTWRRERGFIHERIDDGEIAGRAKMTPVLVADGAFDSQRIIARLSAEISDIDPEIVRLVLGTLKNYPG